jgi:AcrR family transcriptional regulator
MSDRDKRQRILEAATAVFAERDFHRVLVSEVATRAGVGKGTVYLYFPTKDDLHRVALRASLQRLAADVERAAEEPAPATLVLREIVVVILRFFWRRQHLLTLVQRYEQQRGRRATQRRHRVLRAVERVLVRHRLGGGPSERHLTAALLLGLARAAILEHGPADRPEAVAARIVNLYLHGIAKRGSRATRQRVAWGANGTAVRRQRGAA